MRVAVAIMPCLFVAVVAAGRNESVQNGGQVMLQTRLEFNRAEGACTPNIEYVDGAGLDPRGTYNPGNLLSKVVHVTVTLRRDGNLLLIGHNLASNPSTVSLRLLQPVRITHKVEILECATSVRSLLLSSVALGFGPLANCAADERSEPCEGRARVEGSSPRPTPARYRHPSSRDRR